MIKCSFNLLYSLIGNAIICALNEGTDTHISIQYDQIFHFRHALHFLLDLRTFALTLTIFLVKYAALSRVYHICIAVSLTLVWFLQQGFVN